MDCTFGIWFKTTENGEQLQVTKISNDGDHNHTVNKVRCKAIAIVMKSLFVLVM